MIMQGFVGFHIPVWLRRLVTVIPAFIVIGLGVEPTKALVIRQVVLSIALPVPMGALIWFTSRRQLMGRHRNRTTTNAMALSAAALVLVLNVLLIWQTCN